MLSVRILIARVSRVRFPFILALALASARAEAVTRYVDPDGSDYTADGTADAPYQSVSCAFAASADGDEIVLLSGTYPVTDVLSLDKGVHIRGATGRAEDVVFQSDGKSHRVFDLCHQNAFISALTVENATLDSDKGQGGIGAGIRLYGEGGTVSNCVVRGCTIKNWQRGGGGIGIPSGTQNALVTHCVVSNCQVNGLGNGNFPNGGAALAMEAGDVRNCLFTQNVRETSPNDTRYGTVRIQGGTLANCTIAGNIAGRCAGVWATDKKATVVNCLIAGNRTLIDADENLPVWAGEASCFRSCVSDVLINDSCTVEADPFLGVEVGDYRPAPNSAAVNGGEMLDWMTDATDLDGQPRVRGALPDIGCYEFDPSAFAATFTLSMKTGPEQVAADLVVTPVNAGAEGVTCAWDWDGDGIYDEEAAELTTHHVFSSYGRHAVVLRVTDAASGATYTTPAQTVMVYPKTIYVSKDGLGIEPYASEATAANDLGTAFAAAVDGGEIVVLSGTYQVTDVILVNKGVQIRGATGRAEDVVFRSDGKSHRVFDLCHRNAFISALTVENAMLDQSNENGQGGVGAGIRLYGKGGTVSNCVVRACVIKDWQRGGGGIGIPSGTQNALVTHCVVSNCQVNGNGNGNFPNGGGALAMEAGDVRNCLFTQNVREMSPSSSNVRYGTVRIQGGTLANCTIAGNIAGRCAGVWATDKKATVVNCLIAGNRTLVDTEENLPVWDGTASCFTSCVSDVPINDTCTVVAAPFLSAQAGDYHLVLGTAAVDGGVRFDWMTDATDLDGQPRIRGASPDVGCYEADPHAFSANLALSSTVVFAPATVCFEVTPINGGTKGQICQWDWDGDGVFDETTEATVVEHDFTAYGLVTVSVMVTDKASGAIYTPAPQTIMVYPKALYVDKDGSATAPYDQPEKAAVDLASALAAAVDGCEIVIQPGTYAVSQAIVVNKGVRIRGASGRAEDVILQSNGAGHRVLDLCHKSACISALTVENAAFLTDEGGLGAGVRLYGKGGTVSNCVVRGCSEGSWSSGGGGIGIATGTADALITHCIVSNCAYTGQCNKNHEGGGSALTMFAGTVRNCLFVGNDNRPTAYDTSCLQGTIRVSGGTLVNCTIANNTGYACAGVWATEGGEVINCLIAGNTTMREIGENLPAWAGEAKAFSSCAADRAIGDGNALVLSPFVDFASGDYHLAPGTEAVDGGRTLDWMDGATDLDETARVKGKSPDVGCYEMEHRFAIGCAVDRDQAVDALTVSLTVRILDAPGSGRVFVDWGEGAGETQVADTLASPLVLTHDYQTLGRYTILARAEADEPQASVTSLPLSVTVVPSVIWVRPDGDGAVFPYATRETATTNVYEALALARPGCEIRLTVGTYELKRQIELFKAVTVRGETGRPQDVVLHQMRDTGSTMPDGPSGRLAELKNPGALLAGVTLENGFAAANGGGVYITGDGGTLSNCVVSGCESFQKDRDALGGGIFIETPLSDSSISLVTHCRIVGCQVDTTSWNTERTPNLGAGAALAACGGIIRNTLMTGNRAARRTANKLTTLGGTVYLKGRALLESCSVVGNEAECVSGIQVCDEAVEIDNLPVIRNCLVSANKTTGTNPLSTDTVYAGPAGCFDHCVADVAVESAQVTVEAAERTFRHPARGDWRLRVGSAACDCGVRADWMSGATDLDGRPRIRGKLPDAGCLEYQPTGFALLVR